MRNIADVTAGVAELEHDLELCERRITDLYAELGTVIDIGHTS